MKLVSWNVNGLRACAQKGFWDFFKAADADVFSVQETKMQEGQAQVVSEGYRQYWNSAEKKGYSGTLVFSKQEPLDVLYGIDGKYSDEGRLITLEFKDLFLVNSYTPNAQPELKRLDYRMGYEDDLRAYLCRLNKKKGVVLCGDLNVAHEEIDLKNPKSNIGNPGFSYEERGKFSELLAAGFVDSYRAFYPDKKDAYTWWSYRMNARAKNVGWRIDYFVVSEDLKEKMKSVSIYHEIPGSDHCPVGLEIG